MNAVAMIETKRDGFEHADEELRAFVAAYVRGEIPDYQVSAWLMAVYLRGMTPAETASLTRAMAESGDTLDLSAFGAVTVDKHSTGGVGDKTSLIVGPLASAAGAKVAKMSGRGLAHTGGTIDKLESIAGFRTDLSVAQLRDQVAQVGFAIAAQTGELAPADKLLYALRDVTGTVSSLPLIASSIMSKKLAAGAANIVLDVKVGRGAFMKSIADAIELARAMVEIGERSGRRVVAYVTDMNRPLGNAIGNALEVREAVDTLWGQGPEDLASVCLALGAEMVSVALSLPRAGARALVEEVWRSGKGVETLRKMVRAQGGEWRDGERYPDIRQAPLQVPIPAPVTGFVRHTDALIIGRAALALGAGRERKEDVIDARVGIILEKKVGDFCERGETLGVLHARDAATAEAARALMLSAYEFGTEPSGAEPLLYGRITKDETVQFES